MAPHVSRSQWDSMPCRVERNVDVVLQLLADSDAKATFFTLGWVAERYPGIVRRIADGGHELGSHGYGHLRASDQTPRSSSLTFVTRRTCSRICPASRSTVTAPPVSPSVSRTCGPSTASWKRLPIQLERVSGKARPLWNAGRTAICLCSACGSSRDSMTTTRMWRRNLPAGGGGFFRLMPYAMSKWLINRVNTIDRQPALFYFHPWEVDPEQPRVNGSKGKAKFRHYLNLHRTEPRLRRLLADFQWTASIACSRVRDERHVIRCGSRGHRSSSPDRARLWRCGRARLGCVRRTLPRRDVLPPGGLEDHHRTGLRASHALRARGARGNDRRHSASRRGQESPLRSLGCVAALLRLWRLRRRRRRRDGSAAFGGTRIRSRRRRGSPRTA